MDAKIDLVVDGKEISARVSGGDGRGKGSPCFYCGKAGGTEELVLVTEITDECGPIDPSSELFKAADLLLKQKLFHGRSICGWTTECGEKLRDEQYVSVENIRWEVRVE